MFVAAVGVESVLFVHAGFGDDYSTVDSTGSLRLLHLCGLMMPVTRYVVPIRPTYAPFMYVNVCFKVVTITIFPLMISLAVILLNTSPR